VDSNINGILGKTKTTKRPISLSTTFVTLQASDVSDLADLLEPPLANCAKATATVIWRMSVELRARGTILLQ
jgi:hypothetical protein